MLSASVSDDHVFGAGGTGQVCTTTDCDNPSDIGNVEDYFGKRS